MSDYTHWHVGMKVVCVNDGGGLPEFHGLTNGVVYTIREIGVAPSWHVDSGTPVIKLVEIRRPVPRSEPEEIGYRITRFRKVQPRKTDISIFTRFLNDADAPIREDA